MMTTTAVFEHEMLREIYQQPKALADTIEHYAPGGKLATEVFQPVADALRSRARLVIAASGSSRHAGLADRCEHCLGIDQNFRRLRNDGGRRCRRTPNPPRRR